MKISEGLLGTLAYLLILGGIVVVPMTCEHITDSMANAKVEKQKQAADKEIADVSGQYGAVALSFPLPGKDSLTIDLQRSLFVNAKRIVFSAELSDLYLSEKRGPTAAFKVTRGDSNVDVYLRCEEAQLDELKAQFSKNKESTFIVVAEIDKAQSAQVNTENSSNDDYKVNYDAIGKLIYAKVATNNPDESDQ